MNSLQTHRMLVIGDSGSGKTTLVTEHVRRFVASRNAPRYLVILSKDAPHESALAGLCAAQIEVNSSTPVAAMNWQNLITENEALYVEVATYNPNDLLKSIGLAVFALSDVLVVVDEAQFIATRSAPSEFLDLLLRGRKRNIHTIFIGTSLMQRDSDGINRHVINQCTHLVMFAKREPNELKVLAQHAPQLAAIVPDLARADDGSPEYAIQDKALNKAHAQLRSGSTSL